MDAAIVGDRDAFGELAERHRDKLRRHFLYRTSPDDADDLTQQVFLQAWRSIGRFTRTSSPFVAWLMTIAHNLLVDRARAGGAGRTVSTMRPVHAATWEARDDEVDAAANLADPDRMSDPEAVYLLGEEAARVRRALAQLDDGHPDPLGRRQERAPRREVLERRYLRGQEYPAIARDLGITGGNARIRAYRGLCALHRALTGEQRPSRWGAAS